MDLVWIAAISGVLGLAFDGYLVFFVLKQHESGKYLQPSKKVPWLFYIGNIEYWAFL